MKPIITYFKEVKSELAYVKFPTKKDTIKFSLLVIGISLFVGYFLSGIDFGFISIIRQVIN